MSFFSVGLNFQTIDQVVHSVMTVVRRWPPKSYESPRLGCQLIRTTSFMPCSAHRTIDTCVRSHLRELEAKCNVQFALSAIMYTQTHSTAIRLSLARIVCAIAVCVQEASSSTILYKQTRVRRTPSVVRLHPSMRFSSFFCHFMLCTLNAMCSHMKTLTLNTMKRTNVSFTFFIISWYDSIFGVFVGDDVQV